MLEFLAGFLVGFGLVFAVLCVVGWLIAREEDADIGGV
jgi:uncharacterized membrane protein YedE/YeeE